MIDHEETKEQEQEQEEQHEEAHHEEEHHEEPQNEEHKEENEEKHEEGEEGDEEEKRRNEEEEERKRQEEEERQRKLEEAKKLHIITEVFEPIPRDEGEVVTDLKYFGMNQCKRLKNTQNSIRKLLKNKKSAEWWTKCDADGNTLMHIAMKNCWLNVVNELMKVHPGAIYTKNKEGKTPLTLFLEQPQNDNHKILFNLLIIYYHQLPQDMQEEIKDYANLEENVYYKSVLNQNAADVTQEN